MMNAVTIQTSRKSTDKRDDFVVPAAKTSAPPLILRLSHHLRLPAGKTQSFRYVKKIATKALYSTLAGR